MSRAILNPYRIVWLLVLFDLPTDSQEARRDYRLFRGALLDDGFPMMQYSVYARCCPSEEHGAVHLLRIRANLPPDGEVRILQITDKQLSRMHVFLGKVRAPVEEPPEQLEFF